jgi:hypothetical protein
MELILRCPVLPAMREKDCRTGGKKIGDIEAGLVFEPG